MDALSIKAIILQFLGFLLLLWLMRKVAFGPVSEMIQTRTKDVQDTYDKANEALKAAEEARIRYEDHLARIETEAADRLAVEVRRGQEIADKLILDAREESAREQEEARNAIREEFRRARLDLRDFIAESTFLAVEKVLSRDIKREDQLKVIEGYVDHIVEQGKN